MWKSSINIKFTPYFAPVLLDFTTKIVLVILTDTTSWGIKDTPRFHRIHAIGYKRNLTASKTCTHTL